MFDPFDGSVLLLLEDNTKCALHLVVSNSANRNSQAQTSNYYVCNIVNNLSLQ
jgi:hypothetical protein